jgi:hypothetical protein
MKGIIMSEEIESSVNAEPVATVEPQTTEKVEETTKPVETTESVKEEVAAPKVEEKPVQTQEENANYAKLRREYESKQVASNSQAVDDYIKAQGYVFEDKPINTKAEYDVAIAANDEAKRQANMQEEGIDPNIVKDYVNADPTVKWANEYKAAHEQEQAKQAQFTEFAEAYPGIKGDDIPKEVWTEFNKGTSLKVAYALNENKSLKTKLAAYEKGLKTKAANEKNAENSTGSVTGNGLSEQTFYTRDQVNKMSIAEINKDYKNVMESQRSWNKK